MKFSYLKLKKKKRRRRKRSRQPFSGKRQNSRENGCKENEGFFGMCHMGRKLDISKGKELTGHDTTKKTDKTAEEEPWAPSNRSRVRR